MCRLPKALWPNQRCCYHDDAIRHWCSLGMGAFTPGATQFRPKAFRPKAFIPRVTREGRGGERMWGEGRVGAAGATGLLAFAFAVLRSCRAVLLCTWYMQSAADSWTVRSQRCRMQRLGSVGWMLDMDKAARNEELLNANCDRSLAEQQL